MDSVEPQRRVGGRVSAVGSRTWLALALQLAALVVLSLALLGTAWLDPRGKPRVLVLVDRSQSVPRVTGDKALAEVMRAAEAAGAQEVQLIEFAGKPAELSPESIDRPTDLDPSATNIEAALEAALAAHVQAPFASVVVISDGLENAGDAARALQAVREAHLPVRWIAVGREPPQTRIAEVLVPDRALVGQRVQMTVQLAGQLTSPVRIKAVLRAPGGDVQTSSSPSNGAGRATIEFDARGIGPLLVDLALEDPASGRTIDAMTEAAVVDVTPRAAILYAQGSTGALARSLRQGGWSLHDRSCCSARRACGRARRVSGGRPRRCGRLRCRAAVLEFSRGCREEPRPRAAGAGR